jgi:PTH1 family peptidyl-tRNA hydrolase
MIDVIAEAEGISLSSMQFKAMVGKGNILTKDVFLHFKLGAGMLF